MKPERWKHVEALFHEALQLPGEARLDHLAKNCGGDDQLRQEVSRLIAAHEREGSFMDCSVGTDVVSIAEDHRPESPVGQNLGRYLVIGQLGRGGMAEVYLAQDFELQRKIVLKVLPAAFSWNPDRVQRFEREAKAASALNHPNILTIHEVGQAEESRFIATEFVEGATLRERMKSGPMGLVESLEIAIQVASALSAAHRAGIIHRDIKPENVMVRPDGLVKVLDFGLAKLTEQSTATLGSDIEWQAPPRPSTELGAVMGTISYMSPEQALGLEVDHRTDIFSLGVLLYELVAGSHPFQGETNSDVIAAILQSDPLPVSRLTPGLPPELEGMIDRMLAKERQARYNHVAEVRSELRRLQRKLELAEAQVPAIRRHPAPSEPLSSKLRLTAFREPWVWIVVALLVTIAGVTAWHFRPRSVPPVWRAVPLTTYPGFESNPALSPNGKQVAFTWNGEKQDNFDIYVKLIAAGDLTQLTRNPAEDLSPAWSPDGRTIAFLRRFGEHRGELLLIPALGGPERKLAEMRVVDFDESRLRSLAWSPDGRWLAISHREGDDPAEGLFLVSVLTGKKRRLTQPLRLRGDFAPAFSPDGRTLAFSRMIGYSTTATVYLLSLSEDFKPAGEARPLKIEERSTTQPAWTRDGRHIVFLSRNPNVPEQMELRKIALSGLGRSERVKLLEGNISDVSLGGHLVYSQRTMENDIWRAEIPPARGQSSQPHVLISSTRRDGMPRYSPDGKRIAFSSMRSGAQEIWISDAGGSNPLQLTSFRGPLVGISNWFPDGQRLVFHARPEGQADLFTISAAGGPPKRLTRDPSDDVSPSYSRDGHWIYFTSSRSGQSEVWKMPAEGGDATRMTSGGGSMPIESPDGQTLYYAHPIREKGISKVPVQGGEPVQVMAPHTGSFRYAISSGGIFYAAEQASGQSTILFFSFATKQSRPIVVSDRRISTPSISPDERFVLYTQSAQSGSDLMLIENFVLP